MSPKVTMVVFFCPEIPITLSISSSGVTQTGQPGPEIRFMFAGSRSFMPSLAMLIVCVPHTSIKFSSLAGAIFFIAPDNPAAILLS